MLNEKKAAGTLNCCPLELLDNSVTRLGVVLLHVTPTFVSLDLWRKISAGRKFQQNGLSECYRDKFWS